MVPAAPVTMVRLGFRQTWIDVAPMDLERTRARFERDHAVVLPGLLEPDVLAFAQRQVELDGFEERVHDQLSSRPVDLRLKPGVASAVFMLLTNDEQFLEFVRRVTGLRDIRSFRGVVHRRVPNAGHDDAWHNDLVDGRLAVLSINLSSEPYDGGVLQIRELPSGRIVYEFANTRPGDAVLFALGDGLQHRVTPPEGRVARTVCAGWFRNQAVRPSVGLADSGY